jgi:RIO-like serine/threonine protein kinase
MNYQNWQKLHKQAYTSWQQKQVSTYTAEEHRARAWLNLTHNCSTEELEKLIKLADYYRTGKFLS